MSSSSTTSTLSSTTLCYSTVAAAAVTQTCSARKKRHLISDEAFDIAFNIEAEASHEDIISGMEEATAERLVVYIKPIKPILKLDKEKCKV